MFTQKHQYLNNDKKPIPISAFRLNTWCILNKKYAWTRICNVNRNRRKALKSIVWCNQDWLDTLEWSIWKIVRTKLKNKCVNSIVRLFVCLFVCLGFSSHLRIFHSYGDVTITGKGLLILSYARYLWPLSSEGCLAYHTFCDTGHPFIDVISENPWQSRLLPSIIQWSSHYLFFLT